MKKRSILALCALTVAGSAVSQSFTKGDMVVDLGIGFGTADAVKVQNFNGLPLAEETSTGTFTQKLSFEYGIVDLGFGSIGLGAMITNAYGFGVDGLAVGEYNYSYTIQHYRRGSGRQKWEKYQTSTQQRQGIVSGEATTHIDDVNILIKASFHKEFVKNLDTYVTLGLGASIYTTTVSPSDNIQFDSASHVLDKDHSNAYQLVYSYNDADHVKWIGGETKGRFAMALALGARYYFNSHWGVFGELGMTSASFKKNAGVYNIFSFGASYKF